MKTRSKAANGSKAAKFNGPKYRQAKTLLNELRASLVSSAPVRGPRGELRAWLEMWLLAGNIVIVENGASDAIEVYAPVSDSSDFDECLQAVRKRAGWIEVESPQLAGTPRLVN